MKRSALVLSLIGALAFASGCTNVTPNIGSLNGVTLGRVTTRGFFSPSTTSVIAYNTNNPGTIEGTVATASGPGALQSVAQPASIAAAAYLMKPDKTTVNQTGGGASSASSSGAISGSSSHSTSTAIGTGGNGNGGAGGAGGNGGNGGNGGAGGSGQHIPPGHINNPSHNNH